MCEQMSLTRQYRIQQWIEAIRDQKASGLTIKKWCEQNSVTKYQFYYRLKVVRSVMADALKEHLDSNTTAVACTEHGKSTPAVKAVRKADADFVPVPPAYMHTETTGAVMRIRRGASTIEISNDASDRILTMLREVILHAD